MAKHEFSDERWLPVVGWEGLYEVSDKARVRSTKRTVERGRGTMRIQPKILKTSVSHGYQVVGLWRRNRQKLSRVHRLMLEAFVGPCPDGMEACHGNGDRSDNRLDNLRWDTSGSNKYDIVKHGNHVQARKTHCPHGHPYDEENTYSPPSNPRIRYCQTCRRESARKFREKKRQRQHEI